MKILLVLFLAVGVVSAIGRTQAAGAKGRLLCDGKAASGVLVKLYDKDTLDKDDKLAETKTDSNGNFQLSGFTDEVTDIDPKINIYHRCHTGVLRCDRKFSIGIPDSYITSGQYASKVYDAGEIELSGKFDGESHDCIH